MDFSLSDEQLLLQSSVEKYVRDHCGVEKHRRLRSSDIGFDVNAWAEFAELGWLSMPFNEDLGGFGAGAVDLMVMSEALGKGIVREPFLTTVVTCGGFIQRAGSGEQQDRYCADIIAGKSQWAFAFAEQGSGYHWYPLSSRAIHKQGGWHLDGTKLAVLNGHCADFFIVTADTDAGLALFLVDAAQAGVGREHFIAVDGSHGAHVRFDQVAAELLGQPGQAQTDIEQVMATAIIAMGGEALGAMQSLLDTTVEYTKTREQFGQPIGKFQALQHRMADMYLKLEETRSLLFNAAILLDEAHPQALKAGAALKVKMAEAGRFISQQAIQLHGGIGMTDELSVGHYFKRLLLLGMLYGDEDYYLEKYLGLPA